MRTKVILILFLLLGMYACQKEPKASFTVSKSTVPVGETVYFINTSKDSRSYIWDFGDGSLSTQENPVHIYNAIGNYLVTLQSTSTNGRKTDETSMTLTVGIQPTFSLTYVSDITLNSFNFCGNITSDGGVEITSRGLCWSTSHNPTITDKTINIGAGAGSFSSTVGNLDATTNYYVRMFATNVMGTYYSDEFIVRTYSGTLTDITGNVYYTINIGSQVWMAENLRTTKYRDGTLIPNLSDNTAWGSNTSGALSYCNNDSTANAVPYGALYNWYAVSNVHNIAPVGWHVPSDAELTTLTNYLGGEDIAGGKMKEIGIKYWKSPNSGATNEGGFSARPAGYRASNGTYAFFNESAYFWCSSNTWRRFITYYGTYVDRYSESTVNVGFSVRCIKD